MHRTTPFAVAEHHALLVVDGIVPEVVAQQLDDVLRHRHVPHPGGGLRSLELSMRGYGCGTSDNSASRSRFSGFNAAISPKRRPQNVAK